MKSRTKARSIALQVLYEVDISKHLPGDVLTEKYKYIKLDDTNKDFISNIVAGVIKNKTILDEFISDFAPEWPLDQVAIIDRNLLRVALWEIAIYQKTPIKVVINEAIEIGKIYGSDGTPRFINGVLGGFIDNLEEIKLSLEIGQEDEFPD